MKVVIADYGIGNLLSVQRALQYCGADVLRTAEPDAVRRAERLVLPGVGAFARCVRTLRDRGLSDPVLEFVRTGRPMLGICVGMQMLFDMSEEFGAHEGLGLLPGTIRRIPAIDTRGMQQKIPHIGWNAIRPPREANTDRWAGTVFDGMDNAEMYFVHSYTAWPDNPAHRLADADYGGQRISAAVQKQNVLGTQFHPEKSGIAGLRMISQFLQM